MGETATSASGGAAAYDERMKRITDAVELRQPDRVPVAFFNMFWLARYGGISYREAMYNYERLAEIARRAFLELQPDMYAHPHFLTAVGPVMEKMGYKQLQWPGHGTADNVSYQYIDREYMKAEEYDDYLLDPTGFYLHTYLPRVGEAFQGLEQLPMFPGLYYMRLVVASRQFASPAVQRAFAALKETGDEAMRLIDHANRFAAEMAELGFPLTNGATAPAPFDFFADYLRGSKGIMLDMYRRKDKLLAAIERAAIFITRQTIATCRASTSKIVFIPLHWAFDGFMSLAQFKLFFWPSLRKLMHDLIDAGLIPMPLWEGDCTSRLETIADIPRGKAIYWIERADLIRAKEILGDVVCLRGNVPASMLTTGTPDQVDAFSRRLIEKVGKGGGLILDCAIGIPDESKPENVRAMFAAARKYQP
jgi:uroporphyrinogen-III decarboxylase